MTLEYSYLPCRFCVGKNHCQLCGDEICEHLSDVPGLLADPADPHGDKDLHQRFVRTPSAARD